MNIGIVGAGNIGLAMAARFSLKGETVFLFSRHAKEEKRTIRYFDHDKNEIQNSPVFEVTNNIKRMLDACDLIFVTQPAFMFKKLAADMQPHLDERHSLIFVPGFGGVEFAFKDCIQKNMVSIFGFERVPAVYRLSDEGQTANVMGRRSSLRVGCISTEKRTKEVLASITDLFGVNVLLVKKYLNSIVHVRDKRVSLYRCFLDLSSHDSAI